MPSHIYVRVGQYDKAIDNNPRSMQVDQQFAKIWGERPLPNLALILYRTNARRPCTGLHPLCRHWRGNYKTASDAAWRGSHQEQCC